MLYFVLDYFASVDSARAGEYRQRIDTLLGEDAAWEDPMAAYDPTKAVGLSPSATSLRIETEELATELCVRRPELVAKSGESRFSEALHYASAARQLLNYHAAMARKSSPAALLGLRDVSMADNLVYIVSHEPGKVLAFAHNSHMKCGKAEWLWGTELNVWWPAGAHLHSLLGPRYAAIGSAVGVSDANGIGQPEAGTLEERLMAAPGSGRFIPTYKGQGLPTAAIAALPVRSGSARNLGYFPLTAQSLTDFDWLAVLDSTTYTRGWPPLP
jgi:erythromycin esterase-like protein